MAASAIAASAQTRVVFPETPTVYSSNMMALQIRGHNSYLCHTDTLVKREFLPRRLWQDLPRVEGMEQEEREYLQAKASIMSPDL